ncbi:hypothetical protein K4B79_35930 [Streptomyces lincolnensis]|uniref:hypothetical protein n=1 Tax=Streptomyces lincolnensis TaxID=1915 RepID=UPI001E2C9607|nr:hypothetical protein [Streptomyces lincolnensis]MCD7443589.1 hypothetical protein [Streptomyces lincolnensis]
MTYVVTVDTCIPEGTPEMDPLQRAGAVALIEDGFDSVKSVEGPDGVEVDLVDTIVAVHPGGALLKVVVDAPALEFAEDAVQALVDELLERSELLADWRIDRCEVELHQGLAKESLDAADGPDAPPEDPAARKARHAERATAGSTEESHDTDTKATAVRDRMLALADELRSFSPAVFGVRDTGDKEHGVPPDSARLAAGALVHATGLLVDELFEDVQVLTQEDTNVAECEGPLWHLEHLPDRYALRYDAPFARRFLVTVIAMTTRFTDGSFRRLSCVAEELALRFLLGQATTVLELYNLLDDDVSCALDTFADTVYDGMDHEWLYGDPTDTDDERPLSDAAALGIAPTTPVAFASWFTPFAEDRYLHPSATDEPTP